MYFVYIIKSNCFQRTYTGITDNLERRLNQHNAGYNLYTKRYSPWHLIYKEKTADRKQARKRERYFKSAAGRNWMKKKLFS